MYDLENNLLEEKEERTTDIYRIMPLNSPTYQGHIVSASSSMKYIYFLTDLGGFFRIKSNNLASLNQVYRIRPTEASRKEFKEKFEKIWTDKIGNHSIIRFKNSIYYYNSKVFIIKELIKLKEQNIEVCAVGFDQENISNNSTGNILITDCYNNIYEYNININLIDENDYTIEEKIEKLDRLTFREWENEDDEDQTDDYNINNRIYGIKFYKNQNKLENSNNNNININNDNCYIIAVTKNRIYQLKGPYINNSFKVFFDKYKNNHYLYNDYCLFFPEGDLHKKNNNEFTDYDIDIIYNKENKIMFQNFGWRTETGYSFGNFSYDNDDLLPEDIKKISIIPFMKMLNSNKKIKENPIAVTQTINHIFILYNDSFQVISKLTYNIIHRETLTKKFCGILYNEYSPNNGCIILISYNDGLYKIPLIDENKEIWNEYVEIGDYSRAISLCKKENKISIIKKIKKMSAEKNFDEGSLLNAAIDYAESDENFENVFLKFLVKNDYKSLGLYLRRYIKNNLKESDLCQLAIINFYLFDIILNEISKNNDKENKKRLLDEFASFIKQNKNNLDKDSCYQLLQNYGLIEEFVEFATLIQDYETVILHFINEKNIPSAIHKLKMFVDENKNKDILKKLSNLFMQNSHLLFKQCPRESINLLKNKLKNYVDIEIIVTAIVSTTEKDENNSEIQHQNILEKEKLKKKNNEEILSYLRTLIKNTNSNEIKNIHNLYIYYLSKNPENQKELINYLKEPLKNDEDIYGKNKKEVLFQLDYAKKIFKNNPEAFALVLALMGKYTDSINLSMQTPNKNCQEIAKYIASNVPDEKLKKNLWINIFSHYKQDEIGPQKIMAESKILKIEDILPFISDKIKIEDFKKQISRCISEYEENIKSLKSDINEYNKTTEIIQDDINSIKKKSTEIQYGHCKCDICKNIIKDQNIYLFPCGHIFDAICIKNSLVDYEKTGILNNKIKEKTKKIIKYFKKLKIEKDIPEKKENTSNDIAGILSKIISYGKDVVKMQDQNSNKLTDKEKEEMTKELNNLLSEQCILCGEYLVDSVQCSLIDEEKDFIEWNMNN